MFAIFWNLEEPRASPGKNDECEKTSAIQLKSLLSLPQLFQSLKRREDLLVYLKVGKEIANSHLSKKKKKIMINLLILVKFCVMLYPIIEKQPWLW